MSIMLELPTIKTDFLFEKSQDFNQTTHARPQHPTVFLHNITLYFNCISSVKYVSKWSHHGHIMHFSVERPKWMAGKVPMPLLECRLFCFFHFSHSKWWHMKLSRNAQMSKYSFFISLAISFNILSNSFDTSLRQNLL